MRHVLALVLLAALLLPSGATAAPLAASCQFVLGFKTLHDLIPDKVGECRTDEYHNAQNGDGLQETAGGLLAWRKIDNWTAFTDGYRTWVNGPNGLQMRLNTERFSWEKDPITTAPTPTPALHYTYYVETISRQQFIRRGGAAVFCTRLTSPNGGPPVAGLPARIRAYGIDYTATTQPPDGAACVTVAVPTDATSCWVEGWITYNGREMAMESWAHHEGCSVLKQ